MKRLTINEEVLLISIWKLGENAYGINIMEMYNEVTGKRSVMGALYNLLDQLVKKDCLIAEKGESTKVRGGKRKVYYRITETGVKALDEARVLHTKIWEGVPETEFRS